MEHLEETLVSTELKILAHRLGGQSSVADMLCVNRSSISRWVKKGVPGEDNRIRITSLILVLEWLNKIFTPEVALEWLKGINALLGNQRPIDLIKEGRISEVISAIEQTELGSYA